MNNTNNSFVVITDPGVPRIVYPGLGHSELPLSSSSITQFNSSSRSSNPPSSPSRSHSHSSADDITSQSDELSADEFNSSHNNNDASSNMPIDVAGRSVRVSGGPVLLTGFRVQGTHSHCHQPVLTSLPSPSLDRALDHASPLFKHLPFYNPRALRKLHMQGYNVPNHVWMAVFAFKDENESKSDDSHHDYNNDPSSKSNNQADIRFMPFLRIGRPEQQDEPAASTYLPVEGRAVLGDMVPGQLRGCWLAVVRDGTGRSMATMVPVTDNTATHIIVDSKYTPRIPENSTVIPSPSPHFKYLRSVKVKMVRHGIHSPCKIEKFAITGDTVVTPYSRAHPDDYIRTIRSDSNLRDRARVDLRDAVPPLASAVLCHAEVHYLNRPPPEGDSAVMYVDLDGTGAVVTTVSAFRASGYGDGVSTQLEVPMGGEEPAVWIYVNGFNVGARLSICGWRED
eukprot:gb/GECH01004017.1/.p1 GENE.gb/GECH01004017.1/~~gb/GECH01004017.1/.p1  ORF type:complete len:453 (+),score=96.75 gb/GECH01004017.1/:1-1359(+)